MSAPAARPIRAVLVANKLKRMCLRIAFGVEAEAGDAVPQLASAAELLPTRDGRLDASSPTGRLACMRLLSCVDWAARALRIPTAPRRYREQFTINYRALFPDILARNYRVDIFEAALSWTGTRWVNGERFDLRDHVHTAAQDLQAAWAGVCSSLALWNTSRSVQANKKGEGAALRPALEAFDVAWATFEQRYISDLIIIEAAARGLVLNSVEEEKLLCELEKRSQEGDHVEEELMLQRRKFLATVARLNAASNLRWQGREDHSADALEAALSSTHLVPGVDSEGPGERDLRVLLANNCIEAFENVRAYLREVPNWIDAVHPHLCNNPGLVACMCTWTEAWELTQRYLRPRMLLSSMGDLVGAIRSARQLVPALDAMCNGCDAELFLVLPRIVLLWYLANQNLGTVVMQHLVPHHFAEDGAAPINQFADFVGEYHRVRAKMLVQPAGNSVSDPRAAEQVIWEAMMVLAVAGPGCCGEDSPTSPLRSPSVRSISSSADFEAVAEAFMRALERWSMEVQRHCPEEWCQCSSVLLRCLSPDVAPSPTSPSGEKATFSV